MSNLFCYTVRLFFFNRNGTDLLITYRAIREKSKMKIILIFNLFLLFMDIIVFFGIIYKSIVLF